MISRKIYLIPLIILTGCSAPVIKGDSASTQKLASFPKVGVQSTASVGSLAVLHANYVSRHVFKLAKPFTTTAMLLSKISVSATDELLQTDIDGKTVYCTQFKAYIEPIYGPYAIACFKSTTPGKFNSVTYRPGAIWLSKDIYPEIDFVSHEIEVHDKTSPMKRELIYDGSNNQVILFSEKVYENSLTTPSRVRPIAIKISSVPMKVNLNDLEINIIQYSSKSIDFEVTKPWK